MFSLACIITMAACIFLVGIFYSIVNNVGNIAHKVEEEVPITVFFDEGTSEEEIQAIGDAIQSRPEVANIKPLTQAAFVFFIQIFFIDQFFQVIQLLNRFHIGKRIAFRKQYFLIAGKNSACHNQRCCHSNGYTFFEFFIFHIFPFFCTAGKADKITDFLYSSVRRSVFIYRKRLPIFRQPLYIL